MQYYNTNSALTKPYQLPAQVIAGYASWHQCDARIERSVGNDGVNTVIWFSIDLLDGKVNRGPDLDCVRDSVARINLLHPTTVHLMSIGGWNAPHIQTSAYSPESYYAAFSTYNKDNLFHGIDWDLEGNDDKANPANAFSVDCLNFMGRISQLAKRDGLVVAMAPAESYLDPYTSRFSRSLLFGNEDWERAVPGLGFSYHGRNIYAYLLARYGKTEIDTKDDSKTENIIASIQKDNKGNSIQPNFFVDTFDFITIQFYESYSRVLFEIAKNNTAPHTALVNYVTRVSAESGWPVEFSDDPDLDFADALVSVQSTRIVIGLANAWANGVKALLVMPDQLEKAYTELKRIGHPIKGFAFWNIAEEGGIPQGQTKPLWLAREINEFIHAETKVEADVLLKKQEL
ncbi:hypothetical protein HK100_011256 [Physocladia obscura]|uniref:Chitinase n=1 Tax=Physocladia obscura TaxID=109957 RepID=A0AAD5XGQ9_9FUNG|nr:hypothetical protein HK100_011256 [Physocladia obscura]